MPRGWLLLLCAVLLVWQPLTFATEVTSALPGIGMRGAPGILELLIHGLVAAISVAAGWALWQRNPAGPLLATVAIAAGGIISVQTLYWSVLPSNVFPSDKPLLAMAAIAHTAVWLAYLRRSKQVQAIAEA